MLKTLGTLTLACAIVVVSLGQVEAQPLHRTVSIHLSQWEPVIEGGIVVAVESDVTGVVPGTRLFTQITGCDYARTDLDEEQYSEYFWVSRSADFTWRIDLPAYAGYIGTELSGWTSSANSKSNYDDSWTLDGLPGTCLEPSTASLRTCIMNGNCGYKLMGGADDEWEPWDVDTRFEDPEPNTLLTIVVRGCNGRIVDKKVQYINKSGVQDIFLPYSRKRTLTERFGPVLTATATATAAGHRTDVATSMWFSSNNRPGEGTCTNNLGDAPKVTTWSRKAPVKRSGKRVTLQITRTIATDPDRSTYPDNSGEGTWVGYRWNVGGYAVADGTRLRLKRSMKNSRVSAWVVAYRDNRSVHRLIKFGKASTYLKAAR